MENLSRVFQNKKEKKNKEIEFHNNSVQDWVFTTVYVVVESAWKNACSGTIHHIIVIYGAIV